MKRSDFDKLVRSVEWARDWMEGKPVEGGRRFHRVMNADGTSTLEELPMVPFSEIK